LNDESDSRWKCDDRLKGKLSARKGDEKRMRIMLVNDERFK